VIDNDAEGSARPTVDRFGPGVRYSVEPTPGIAAARNHTLRSFADGGYEALIFVDDDEFVPEGWLDALLSYARSTTAGVVSGPVITVLPPNAPAWILRGGFLQRPVFPTGTRHWTAATNNTLLRSGAWRSAGSPWFDETFSSTGGSDTDFFCRLADAGTAIEFCASARVYEDAPAGRLTWRWMGRRWVRMGIARGRILRRSHGPLYVVVHGGTRIAAGAGGLLRDLLTARGPRATPVQRLCHGVGEVLSQSSYRVHEYARAPEAAAHGNRERP
jgi:hypothetical protein